MVFFIDGLDEAIQTGNTILKYIPTSRSWFSVICASRRVPEVEAIYDNWDHHHTQEMQVSRLSTSDIRALLYEVVSKYDDALTDSYINAIAEHSQGNPL